MKFADFDRAISLLERPLSVSVSNDKLIMIQNDILSTMVYGKSHVEILPSKEADLHFK